MKYFVSKRLKLFYITCGFCLLFTLYLVIKSSWRSSVLQMGKPAGLSNQRGNLPASYLPKTHMKHNGHDAFYQHTTNEDFWDEHALTIYDAIAKHNARTLESCDNRCDESGCRISKLADWNWLSYHSQVPYKRFLARGQYVFPWEKTYLSRPPLEDSRMLPDLNKSKVTLKGVTAGVVQCNISDILHGRLDLVDGYGNLRTTGDDEVRVWIKSEDTNGFAASGNVTDLKNGSYLFSFMCLWPGMSSLNVAVAYPREFLRVVIHQVHIGVTRYVAMTFVKGNINETTLCWPTPNIPGRPCVCNMTQYGQETFYCGRPKDPRLTCDDWETTEKLLTSTQPHNVTEAERELIKNSTGKAASTVITHQLKIFANSGSIPILQTCHQAPLRTTWSTTMPKGYWSPDLVWNSLLCRDAGKITTNWTLNCLRNTNVWVLGDSNGFRLFQSLTDLTKCKHVVGKWPFQPFCYLPEIGLNISCMSHENPRYARIARNETAAPVNAVLDTVPASGRHVIIIHYYLHYTPSHLGVLYLRMKRLKEAIVKLLERNQDVLIGIRGPHIATKDWDYNHAIGGDPLGSRYIDIIRDVFRGLENRVVYIDGWEMSIAIENEAFHPPIELTREMVKYMLSYFCQ